MLFVVGGSNKQMHDWARKAGLAPLDWRPVFTTEVLRGRYQGGQFVVLPYNWLSAADVTERDNFVKLMRHYLKMEELDPNATFLKQGQVKHD